VPDDISNERVANEKNEKNEKKDGPKIRDVVLEVQDSTSPIMYATPVTPPDTGRTHG